MALSRPILLAVLAAVLTGLAPVAAHATKSAPVTGLAQTYEYVWNNPNPYAPSWCLNEDDWHMRTWTGSLNGTFTATERLCDPAVDFSGGFGWDAGGIGVQADLVVAGSLTDL